MGPAPLRGLLFHFPLDFDTLVCGLMPDPPDHRNPKRLMQRGVQNCRAGRWQQGLDDLIRAFEDGIPNEPEAAVATSYLGYSMARRRKEIRKGLALCRHALEMQFYNPEILLNMARTEILAGNRKKGVEALHQGLSIDPQHAGLLRFRREIGYRRPVPIKSLSRDNPVNRFLSWLRRTLGNA